MFDFYTLHQTLRKKEWSYDTEYYELVVSTAWYRRYRTMVYTVASIDTQCIDSNIREWEIHI